MSLLINFSIFPLDKGESVSQYVARTVEIIKDSGLPYKLGAMGTSIEGEWDELMAVVNRCLEAMRQDYSRVSLSLKADFRAGPGGRLKRKVESVLEKLG